MGAAITALRNTPALRWANTLEVKNAVESALEDRFGAKEAARPKGKVCPRHPRMWVGWAGAADSRCFANRNRSRQSLRRPRLRLLLLRLPPLTQDRSLRKVSSASCTSLVGTRRSRRRCAMPTSRLPVGWCTRVSRQNRTGTCTSDTPRPSSLILATPHITVGGVIYGTMTQTPRQRKQYTLRVYWRSSVGSALNHGRSHTRATTLMSCMALQSS